MALPITEQLVARAAEQLRSGGWRFTLRQLYYASCAAAEVPATNAYANGQMAIGVLLLLVAFILIGFKIAFAVFAAAGVASLVMGFVGRVTTKPPQGRVLAMSYEEFAASFSSLEVEGLIASAPMDAPPPRPQGAVTAGEHEPVVVCDSRETALAVACNAACGGLNGTVVIAVQDLHEPPARCIVVHDASPPGCALPLELHDRGCDAVDAGLRPLVADAAAQVLEGAPARLPRDLAQALEPAEIDWLLSGRRVEIATLTPQQLLALVREALATAR